MRFSLNNIVFIDIETVSSVPTYQELDEGMKTLWKKKISKEIIENSKDHVQELFETRAGIFAEFGKIVCISIGMYSVNKNHFRIKSFYHESEKDLLLQFVNFSQRLSKKNIPCGHNIKEFDIPYLSRRLLINGMDIPLWMDYQGMKPWDIEIYDTLQLWKFGDYKHYTSLSLLSSIFQIPSPKEDIDGSMVGKVYWLDNDLKRIATYCEEDVIAVIKLYHRLHNKVVPDDALFVRIDH